MILGRVSPKTGGGLPSLPNGIPNITILFYMYFINFGEGGDTKIDKVLHARSIITPLYKPNEILLLKPKFLGVSPIPQNGIFNFKSLDYRGRPPSPSLPNFP